MESDDDHKTSNQSSFFACYSSSFTCGGGLEGAVDSPSNSNTQTTDQNGVQPNSSLTNGYYKGKTLSTDNMRRASVSRRAEHLSSPRLRSRSQEGLRNLADEEEDRILDQLAAEADIGDSEHVDTSSRAIQKDGSQRGHRRAMSDPFDAQETEEEGDVFLDAVQANQEEGAPLSTLPRYPVAAQRNKNCWSEPPVSIFHVRGPVYFSDKKKVPSEQYLLPARGADLFLTDTPVDYGDVGKSEIILGGRLRKLPTLMINFQFPWGNMLLYHEIPQKLTKYLTETPVALDPSLTAAETTLAAWLQGDDTYKNDRLKLIPYVAEGPWVVRSMVTGKPAVIGKRLPVRYQLNPADATTGQAALLECTLDIGSSSATAKRIVSVCRRYMSALTVDIGFVIQAETAGELPEQMLGSIRIHGVDPLQAPKLS